MLNKAMVIGHLGADPELKYTANGAAVATFNVAAGRKWTGEDGQQHEETEWFRVVTWNRLAETCGQYLAKGRLVYVEGRLQTRSWDDKEGTKRYTTELVANEVKFLGGRDAAVGGGAEPEDVDEDDLPF